MHTTTRLGVFLAVAAMSTVACTDDGPSANEAQIATWQARMKGHTVSYHLDISCFCMGVGGWRVVERDGEVLEAEYLGDGDTVSDEPAVTLSAGLQSAAMADGPVTFSDVTDNGLSLDVDVIKDANDDEFSITVSDFVVEA